MLFSRGFLLQGVFMDKLYSIYLECRTICTDTRNISEGCLFFALRGERFNGNEFASQALEKGASYAVVDDASVVSGQSMILVDDVLETLQHLARLHRSYLSVPVLALTGSNGKTTTKELTRDVLGQKYRVHATKGNLNNHIGVPLTILSAPDETEFLLIEMGANHQGEIDALCRIAEPAYAMITNIGKAHLEGFGGVEGIKKGKSEMYRYVSAHNGKIFVNTEDAILSSLLPSGGQIIPYAPSALIRLESTEPTLLFTYRDQYVKTHLYGAYNVSNIAFAIAAGEYFGVPYQKIADAISRYVPENNRSQLKEWQGNILILDAYNANPTSMKASLESLAKMPGYKVAVLGDMLELGEYSQAEHEAMIEYAHEIPLDEVLFIGPCFSGAGQHQKGRFFQNVEEAKLYFQSRHFTNAHILLKGSRGIAVESILN